MSLLPRAILRDCLPPCVIGIYRRLAAVIGRGEWEYVPEGWREADSSAESWDLEQVASVQQARWGTFQQAISGSGPLCVNHEHPSVVLTDDLWSHNQLATFAYVAALAAQGGRLALLDWGGGSGHYGALARALLPEVRVNYTCQDVPALARLGAQRDPEGTYLYEPDACFARKYDLVMAGSSLWYLRDWHETAAKLAACTERYLYLTRMLFVDRSADFVVRQRPRASGYATEYLCWVYNRQGFIRSVEALRMELVREFFLGRGPYLHRAPEQAAYRGFLFRPAPGA